MLELKGKYNSAKVFTDNIDSETISQVITLLNQEFVKDAQIRIMPDCHAGAGCTIGFTADLGDKVIPNIVGVDIGCGMLCVNFGKIDIDFVKFDNIIKENIPSGYDVHEGRITKFPLLQDMHCYRNLKDTKRIMRSLGTLGGGNHFIELDKDSNDNIYLVIHTGSRNLGKQVADYYQDIAYKLCRGADELYEAQNKLIADYKAQGRRKEIQDAIVKLKQEFRYKETKIPKDLCYLTDEYRQQYLDDMNICQQYAQLNRRLIANIIIDKYLGKSLDDYEYFETVHNYININDNIIRKGSVSARDGEKLLIPINMRDGSLICVGKGNPGWNYSAPHGAGRIMSRSQAKDNIDFEEFKESMNGIYSTSVVESTIDESPMVYKPIEEIINNIGETVDIIEIIKPIYNFKAH